MTGVHTTIWVVAIFAAFLLTVVSFSALGGVLIRAKLRRPPDVGTVWAPEIVSWQIAILLLSLASVIRIGFRSQITAALLVPAVAICAVGVTKILKSRKLVGNPVALSAFLLFTIAASLLACIAFVSWPVDLPELLRPVVNVFGSRIGHSEHPILCSGKNITLSDLNNLGGHFLGQDSKTNSLDLEACTLNIDIGLESITLTFDELHLGQGSTIITNGTTLKIRANELVSDQGSILSFAQTSLNPPTAVPGRSGFDGRDGGQVFFDVDRLEGQLRVDLRGQNGGEGGNGLPGIPGAPGPRGSNGVDSFVGCAHGGTDGAPGSPGSAGGPGGAGGKGGNGGSVFLHAGIIKQARQITLSSLGGEGGAPGNGGPGGQGGPGGEGGSGSAFCGGGHAAGRGTDGPPGAPGTKGQSGTAGPSTPQDF
jgi:hypothetical protein